MNKIELLEEVAEKMEEQREAAIERFTRQIDKMDEQIRADIEKVREEIKAAKETAFREEREREAALKKLEKERDFLGRLKGIFGDSMSYDSDKKFEEPLFGLLQEMVEQTGDAYSVVNWLSNNVFGIIYHNNINAYRKLWTGEWTPKMNETAHASGEEHGNHVREVVMELMLMRFAGLTVKG
jgi:hypothetical protein